MSHRVKMIIRSNPTIYRTSRSIANRLQPLIDFSKANFGGRRGRRFAKAGDYFRPTLAAGYIGWVGNRNIGDEALFNAFQQLFPNHTPILYDRHPFELRLHQRLVKRASRFFDFVALGGGTLFSYRPYYYQVDHAINNGFPLITFGTGLEDPEFYTDEKQRTEYETLLKDWSILLRDQPNVFVRGPRTADILRQYGMTNVRVIGDPALTICTPKPHSPRQRVGINLGCDGKMWGTQAELNASIIAAVRYLIDLGWQIDFLSMEPVDYDIACALARQLGSNRVRVGALVNTPPEILAQLSQCDFVIGQRLHAVILAAGMSIPMIALQYRPKVADFMESVDMMPLSLRTDSASPDRLISLIDDVRSRLEQLSQQLTQRCDAFRQIQREAAQITLDYVNSRQHSRANA